MTDVHALLMQARQRYTQDYVAKRLGRSARTVARWERGKSECPEAFGYALQDLLREGKKAGNPVTAFTFVDLFAGIGGMRLGFEAAGGKCVYTSEWNEWSRKTYLANFNDEREPAGDITQIQAEDIPDHDVLLAGFPCQPFSLAGVSKKNALGRPHGFECDTQGTLFFDIQRIIAEKQPKAFLLENVKNLLSHDRGNTFRIIRGVLEESLGYQVHFRVVDAGAWVPQHRERLLIVGFRESTDFNWNDLRMPDKRPSIETILHPEDGSQAEEPPYTIGPKAVVASKYTLTPALWDYLQRYAAKHAALGNGFGFGLIRKGIDQRTRTLSARYHKDGSEILLHQGGDTRPRRLTPRECARLMGFPEDFRIPVSDTQAYRQFGNSVVVPLVTDLARIMAPRIMELKQAEADGVWQESLLVA